MALPASKTTVPPKRLVMCCDGTFNDSVSTNDRLTNVSRLSRCIDDVDAEGTPQILYYRAGIGSGTSKRSNLKDAATGRGIHQIIKDAYTFICLNHNPQDEIFLIGFSRGAYTVRCLANFIAHVGLLSKVGLGNLHDLYQRWINLASMTSEEKKIFDQSLEKLKKDGQKKGQKDHQLRTDISIEVCAVWDSVSSLGLPASFREAPLDFLFNNIRKVSTIGSESVPPRLKHAFQALALSEDRKDFKPILWAESPDSANIRQCWFLGAHSDVGGGSKDYWIANISLIWMVAQLRKATRLSISDDYLKQFLDPNGLSRPQDHRFTAQDETSTHRAGPSTIMSSRSAIRRGLVSNPWKGFSLFGIAAHRAPGGPVVDSEASTQGVGVTSNDVNGQAPKAATGKFVEQSIHSSVRILMNAGVSNAPVMEWRRTEIIQPEEVALTAKNRVIWRCFDHEGKLGPVQAIVAKRRLCVYQEGEILEDIGCDEEARLMQIWVDILGKLTANNTEVDGESSQDIFAGKASTSTKSNSQGSEAVSSINQAAPTVLVETSKDLPEPKMRLPNLRELIQTFIKEARAPTQAWMWPPSQELVDLGRTLSDHQL